MGDNFASNQSDIYSIDQNISLSNPWEKKSFNMKYSK